MELIKIIVSLFLLITICFFSILLFGFVIDFVVSLFNPNIQLTISQMFILGLAATLMITVIVLFLTMWGGFVNTFSIVGELLEVVKSKNKKLQPNRTSYILHVGIPNGNTSEELNIIPLYISGTEEETKHMAELLFRNNWYVFNGIIVFRQEKVEGKYVTQSFFKVMSLIPLGVERTEAEHLKLNPNPKYVRKPSQAVINIKTSQKKLEELKGGIKQWMTNQYT